MFICAVAVFILYVERRIMQTKSKESISRRQKQCVRADVERFNQCLYSNLFNALCSVRCQTYNNMLLFWSLSVVCLIPEDLFTLAKGLKNLIYHLLDTSATLEHEW